jgi:hypothetical protein
LLASTVLGRGSQNGGLLDRAQRRWDFPTSYQVQPKKEVLQLFYSSYRSCGLAAIEIASQ